ncbi:MAG: glucose-6-phosphate isomerase [Phycisphaerales bacterium JB039]
MLTLDCAGCFQDRVGPHGLDPDELAPGSPADASCRALTARLAESRGTGMQRWRLLPHDPMRSEHLDAIGALVDKHKGATDTLVVLGIGGSALGNIALHSALNPPTHNLLPAAKRRGPRLFVLDNVDPALVKATLDLVSAEDPGFDRTLFNVISKSGETAETAAQFMIVRDMLAKARKDRAAERIVAITDPAQGTMRRICDEAGYDTLPVPDGVGGRFSALSPVGLFSSAMVGIDIAKLLDGAAAMDKRCASADLAQNPAARLAAILVALGAEKGKSCHVMMPYANSLYLLADWFRQLWAESLGKLVQTVVGLVGQGFTPIKALGATDQHSQIQLYREGPNDKVIGFLEVEDFGADVAIPAGLGVDSLEYLEGASLGRLLAAEKRATEYALIDSGRPNFTLRFPRIDEQHVGEFMWLWQMATAYAGLMLGVNAYDQPAVETGKKATFGLMGRAGSEQWRDAVDSALGSRE